MQEQGYMKQLAEKYLTVKPSKKLKVLEVEIPCDTTCLKETEFEGLLNNQSFKEQLEIIDSLEDLINSKIDELLEELKFRFPYEGIDYGNLAYTTYRIVEYGGNVIIGERLTFNDRVIFAGSYDKIYEISKKIEEMKKDQNIKAICDEIKYLGDSLWVHFDKNLRRLLNEI